MRRNWAVEEVVGAFKIARPTALEIATKDKREKEEEPRRPAKRRRTERNSGGDELTVRTTRSQSKRTNTNEPPRPPAAIDIPDNDEGSDEEYIDSNNHQDPPEDGLVACPICQTRMKEEAVYAHMDTSACTTAASTTSTSSQQKQPSKQPLTSTHPSTTKPKPLPDRISELNYSLLNEKALRKKLTELGIPITGTKSLLARRHTEWVNLWNANVDAGAPKTKRELLDELRKWDRSIGREPEKYMAGSEFMKKDFDAQAWSSGNKDEFSRLIEMARAGRNKAATKPEDEKPKEQQQSQDTPMEIDNPPRPASPEKDLPSGYHDASRPQENYPDPKSTQTPQPPPPSAQMQQQPGLKKEMSLGENFGSAQSEQVNMFEVPGHPFKDVENIQEAGER